MKELSECCKAPVEKNHGFLTCKKCGFPCIIFFEKDDRKCYPDTEYGIDSAYRDGLD